jgi:hypothetical protein
VYKLNELLLVGLLLKDGSAFSDVINAVCCIYTYLLRMWYITAWRNRVKRFPLGKNEEEEASTYYSTNK